MTKAARVRAAWDEYRDALASLRDPDFSQINGLTPAEQLQALRLFAAGHSAELDDRGRKVALLAYLARHAPGAPSIDRAIGQLSAEQLQDFMRIIDGEVEQ